MKIESFQNNLAPQTAEVTPTEAFSHGTAASKKRSLFHFTRLEYLSSILAHGIDSGYTPINPWESVPGVCLTEVGDPFKQPWTHGLPKNGFRISVELENDDPLLLSFGAFAKRFQMSKRDSRDLCQSGKGHPDKWSVYLGPIPVSAVRGVWFSPLKRFLTPGEILLFQNEPYVRGEYPAVPNYW